MRAFKESKGITLIALVITIIVLLILAGVTISTLTGKNGILTKTTTAKEKTEIEEAKEQAKLDIEAEMLERMQNNNNERLTNEEIKTILTGKDYVRETKEDHFLTAKGNYKIMYSELYNYTEESNKMYNVEGNIEPAPQELFDIEPITDETARIKGMNSEYITNEEDNYYHIEHEKVGNTLVIPYETEIDGKRYRITEVELTTENPNVIDYWGNSSYSPIPEVEIIIYPNTVTKLCCDNYREGTRDRDPYENKILEKVIFSNALEEIADGGIFFGCTNLKTCKLPEGLKKIGSYTFGNYYENVEAQNGQVGLESINIPNSVTEIGGYAFNCCRRLKNIEFPSSLASIGNWAFSYCSGLKNINIPSSVTSIGDSAFYECTSLASVNISNGVTSIGNWAFSRCSGLTNINIPSSVTSIGDGAFSTCTGVESINIPSSVTTMGKSVFGKWTAEQTINCEAESQPSSWDRLWNYEYSSYGPRVEIKAMIKWKQ